MKKLFLIGALLSLTLSGCSLFSGSKGGGYTGPTTKPKPVVYRESSPYGMKLIPDGALLVGGSDEDIFSTLTATPKPITVDAFWMDETEVTNGEYRNFTNYVKEYNLRKELGYEILEDEYGNPLNEPRIDWSQKISYKDQNVQDIISSMMYSPEESVMGKREVDVRRLVYEWQWIDYQQAARTRWSYEENKYIGTIINDQGEEVEVASRADFIKKDGVNVYPDTLCWIRDYAYMYNDALIAKYFWHPAYNDYPVVGVTWKQAKAYARWKTEVEAPRRNEQPHEYRLPTEVEWEYAARGGIDGQLYPWGGYYTTNKEGCYLANFKPQRGRYGYDGGVRPIAVASYEPNEYGLYDMAGNVAEWTDNAFDENAYAFYHDLAPIFTHNALKDDPTVQKRKVIRGGSWKDIAYYIQCGTRTFEYQDSAKCYIGFRTVRQYAGPKAYNQ